jgi:outer membrane protein OmpA-like peptidoglycan-associated protein
MIFRLPTSDITPFVHGLVGGELAGGPYFQKDTWGVVLTAGGGLDYSTPLFDHHLAIRVFQADYQYTHEDFGPGALGGRGNPNMARLSTGVVYHIGTIAPPPPVTLSCSANPTSVFPGDPVTLTATTGGGDPKMTPVVSWSGVQGLTGTGTTATIATASLAPGSYTAKCAAKEGKPGKEGLKPWENAEGSATFTVKAFEPPTLSCSASPTTIKPGDSATVTATGMSPQNRPLTYSYSASAGTISGSGTSATFSSTGAPTGPASITCNVTDDKGQTATANTSVTITAPYVPPTPHTQALCSITFSTDKARPTRVDNEAKACLDEVALDLQKQSDAKAVIVGESNAKEKATPKHKRAKKVVDVAAERAVNTKEYLVTEKGIDASRISVATGTTDDQKVEDYLVPAGANFSTDVSGSTPVDESVVKPQVRKPLGAKVHHKKATKK